jgi:hypothetical protein
VKREEVTLFFLNAIVSFVITVVMATEERNKIEIIRFFDVMSAYKRDRGKIRDT